MWSFSFLRLKSYNLYLYYLKYRFTKSKSPYDLILIFKNITYFKKEITTDEVFCLLIDCFSLYPLSDLEIQKLSIWQQCFSNDLGLLGYLTITFWLSAIYCISEKYSKTYLITNSS